VTSPIELAASYFDPVAERHGLQRSSMSGWRVVYRRGEFFLYVWFDYRGAEFGVNVGRGPDDQPERKFDLSEILQMRGVVPQMGISAFKEDNQRIVLEELARLTTENAADFMAGDEVAFAQGAEYKRRQEEERDLASLLDEARRRAFQAALAGNHSGVVAALEPVEGNLSKLDLWRLQHARKRSGH
jgi:hypothetical protein